MILLTAVLLMTVQPPAATSPVIACPWGMQAPAARGCPIMESAGFIVFDAGSIALSTDARGEIDSVLRLVATRPGTTFSILGHRDAVEHQPRLDRRRAEAVRVYLVAHGIRREAIKVRAMGDRYPAVDVPAGQAEPQNRRVELLPIPPHRTR